MLTRDQLQWLENALDENANGNDGAILLGKTYTEMQVIFNQRMGTNLSAEGLRYHVRNFGKKGLNRGRQPYRSEDHKWIGIFGHLLLAITRWSPRQVYLLMRANTRLLYPRVTCAAFYKILAATKPVRARLPEDPLGSLLRRQHLRLHQITVLDAQGEVPGVLLVGFEPYIGLCNARWYEMRYTRRHLKPGRPRKIPSATDEEAAAYRVSGSEIHLPDAQLVEFCSDCQARFFVPLTRFLLPRGYSKDTIGPSLRFSDIDPLVEVSSQPESVVRLPEHCNEKTLKAWRVRLMRWIDRHNRHLGKEALDEAWKYIESRLSSATAITRRPRLMVRDKRRTAWMKDEQLQAFYRVRPRYTGHITPLSRRIKVLRLEKKPDEPGKAG